MYDKRGNIFVKDINMNKKEIIIACIITLTLAGLDLLGYPAAWFVNISGLDINPIYFILIVNQWILIIIGLISIHYLCPSFEIGLDSSNLRLGIKKNWKLGMMVVIYSFLSIFLGGLVA